IPTSNGTLAAADLHRVEMAALADNFAVVVPSAQDVLCPCITPVQPALARPGHNLDVRTGTLHEAHQTFVSPRQAAPTLELAPGRCHRLAGRHPGRAADAGRHRGPAGARALAGRHRRLAPARRGPGAAGTGHPGLAGMPAAAAHPHRSWPFATPGKEARVN